MSCSVVALGQESPSSMRSTQRRARVDVEAGEPRRQSLVHNDARLASHAGNSMEAGELHDTRSTQGRARGDAEAGES
jgi:hypothetical protein